MNLNANELQIIACSLESYADLIETEIANDNALYSERTALYFTLNLRSALLDARALINKVQEALDNQINL